MCSEDSLTAFPCEANSAPNIKSILRNIKIEVGQIKNSKSLKHLIYFIELVTLITILHGSHNIFQLEKCTLVDSR
uniref:Uncharacterized protein n=1 Tax=Arundo donax TaxID=35708 RepID=A0A0A9D0Q8_ARUDO